MNTIKFQNIIFFIISIFCVSLSQASFKHDISESDQASSKSVLNAYLLEILNKKTDCQEGLLGCTLVKTDDGFTQISLLKNNGSIAGTSGQASQKVILNQPEIVTYLFEIELESTRIYAAPKQQFYDTELNCWIEAKDLTAQNHVSNQAIKSCRKVQRFTTVYKLTTEQHVFFIEEPEILTHNANIATIVNASSIVFGACSCSHPVVAAIGRTISLAKLALSTYAVYQDLSNRSDSLVDAMQEEEVVLTTRSYYETRRKDLLAILEQYRAVKQSVFALCSQWPTAGMLFSMIPAVQINISILPSLQSELSYSAKDKQNILQLREQELASIEAEINALQISLMIHLQDHGNRLTQAMTELDPAYNLVLQCLKIKTPHHDKNAAITTAAQTYSSMLALVEAVENLEQKMFLVARLVQYYQHPGNGDLLKKSTNLLDLCRQHSETLNQINIFLPKLKKYALTSQQSAYSSLTQAGLLSQYTISTIQYNLQSHRNNVEQGQNANAKINQAQITHGTPPNDPDPEDDTNYDPNDSDDFYQPNKHPQRVEFIENNKGHIFENRDGHVIDSFRNRRILQKVVQNKKNKLSEYPDSRGNFWYSYILPNGKQWWAKVREKNGVFYIENAGLNITPKPFDPTTGLSRNINQNPIKRS